MTPDLCVEYENVVIIESSPVIYNSDILYLIQSLLRYVPEGMKATIRATPRVIEMIKVLDKDVISVRGDKLFFGDHEILSL